MVLKITQETFDNAVQENVEILGMSEEEALSEAIKQFESQGVDLSSISKALKTDRPQPKETQDIVKNLKQVFETDNANPETLSEALKTLKAECDKGMDYKIFAATAGAYNVILDVISKFTDNVSVVKESIRALTSLMTKNPDLLDERGLTIILPHIDEDMDKEATKLVLKWIKECCVMHEMNRQNFVKAQIVNKLKTLLISENNTDYLKEILAVFRALILDDDVRVEFGKAHDHAKHIASEALLPIIQLMNKNKTEEAIMCDLVVTLSSLMVRTEFCNQLEEANGLQLLLEIMQTFLESEKLTRQCFKLLKSLAGNDDCKAHIMQKGFAPVIASSLLFHKGSSLTASHGLLAISSLSLRAPENSKALYEAGLPKVIVQIMKMHPEERTLQKNGSWAVRNMVSRSRYQNPHFLELGVEEILQNDMKKFQEFAYDFKAALRDLECNVQFNEEWTGKGGRLTTDSLKI